MRTLHLRNVPDEVMVRLERLARQQKMSVSAVAIRELDASTRRVDNASLMASWPDLPIDPADIVADIAADRR
ncbi:antitoxin [Mycobacterium sp. HUMS_1102779]|jgi:hypothetical protein|uniref:antitoxin n=1 Tax=Mycobacterium sp. HUMS_1102779 TaxID=3383487 RepID=UPI00389AB4BD